MSTVVVAGFSVAVLRIIWAVATYLLLAIVVALLLRVARLSGRVPCAEYRAAIWFEQALLGCASWVGKRCFGTAMWSICG